MGRNLERVVSIGRLVSLDGVPGYEVTALSGRFFTVKEINTGTLVDGNIERRKLEVITHEQWLAYERTRAQAPESKAEGEDTAR